MKGRSVDRAKYPVRNSEKKDMETFRRTNWRRRRCVSNDSWEGRS
jgi:hypothetical protein